MNVSRYKRLVLVMCLSFFYAHGMKRDVHMRPEVKCSKEPRYGVPSEEHITIYLLAGSDLSNAVLGIATFVAYRDVPYEKTHDILRSHFFTHSDFTDLFKTHENIIVLQNVSVTEEYRFKGFGKTLLSEAFQYMSAYFGNSLMVWHAYPNGEKTLSLEKLCALYKKYGGIMLGSDKDCARFYKKM